MSQVRVFGVDRARGPKLNRCGVRGFARAELVAVLAVLGASVSLVALLESDARRRSRLAGSTENLHTIGSATPLYAADKDDRFWSFSWRAGSGLPSGYPDLQFAGSDQTAQIYQAVDIIRRRSGLNSFPAPANWLPHVTTSAIVLADHLGERLPAPWMVSPEDDARLDWRRDPQNICASVFAPSGCSTSSARIAFSSSYEVSPVFYSPDAASGAVQTISQGSQHNQYFIPTGNGVVGARRLSDVSFPSHKAMVYDSAQRHFGGRTLYFLAPEARSLVLAADGAVSVRRASAMNAGFQPNSPNGLGSTTLTYQPDPRWEPPTSNGMSSQPLTGRHRWTRSGLRGRDFAGPEVVWVP